MKSLSSKRKSSRSSHYLFLIAALVAVPSLAEAQSGKWAASIQIQTTSSGTADITIEPRDDKHSRVKFSVRGSKSQSKFAWDIVAGRCRDEGVPVAQKAVFSPLQTRLDGSGEVIINLPKLESGKLYYVRVYEPRTVVSDASAYGCGALVEKP